MEDNQENKEINEKIETELTEKTEETQNNKEIVEVKKKKKLRKGNHTWGTLGAILGGAVAAIPWILVYTFFNGMVIPVLGIFIPIGTYLGYRIFRGRISKKSRVIITIVSLLIIALVTTIVSPAILVILSSYDLNWENIIGLYSESRQEIRVTFLEDLAVGVIFTILGLIIVIKFFINKKLKNAIEETKLILTEELKVQSEIIKKVCIDLNCMSKENAARKKQIFEQLKVVYNIKRKKSKLYFKNCLLNKLLKKYKGKYYYDETDEAAKIENIRKMKNKYTSPLKVIVTILVLAIIGVAVVFYMESNYTIPDTDVELSINPITQVLYGTWDELNEGIGEAAAEYYSFIIEERNEKYEISGMLTEKAVDENDEPYDIDTVIQQDRDYFATYYFGEDETSAVETKELEGKSFRFYYYNYISNTEKHCRAHVYLYELEDSYLWVEVRSTIGEYDLTEIDNIIQNLFK